MFSRFIRTIAAGVAYGCVILTTVLGAVAWLMDNSGITGHAVKVVTIHCLATLAAVLIVRAADSARRPPMIIGLSTLSLAIIGATWWYLWWS